MKMNQIFVLILIFCFASTMLGQGLDKAENKNVAASSLLLVRAGQVVDLKEGRYLKDQGILIQGGQIKQVGPFLSVRQQAPEPCAFLDLSQLTVLPGLIDVHTHLLLSYDPTIGFDDINMVATVSQVSTAMRALKGAALAREELEAGITTVRDVGNSGINGDIALRDAIAAGYIVGPRMLVSTRALAAPGGQFPRLQKNAQGLVDQEYVVVTNPNEGRAAVQQAIYDGADLIKVIVNTGERVIAPDTLKSIVNEAHRVGKKVAAHATNEFATAIAVGAGVDSVEHAYYIDDEELKLMASKKIFMVPTDQPVDVTRILLAATPNHPAFSAEAARDSVDQKADRIRRAITAGVPLAFGSDMYYEIPGMTRGEASLATLRAYAAEGLSPLQILRMATIDAAALLGLKNQIGDLAPNMSADLIAVQGDPLQDISSITQVRVVIKAGAIIRNNAEPARAVLWAPTEGR